MSKALGKGLSALMGEEDVLAVIDKGRRDMVAIDAVSPNLYQPRVVFDEQALHELADSIKRNGVLVPILVRVTAEPNKYEIVAGERRWRASKIAGLSTIPAVIVDIDNTRSLELALVENMQRQDLSPIEEAKSMEILLQSFNYTHEKLAEAVGKSRSHVTNLLRLLTLPSDVQQMILSCELTMGHARAIINAKSPLAIAQRVVSEGLSVRAVENIVRAENNKNFDHNNYNKPPKKTTSLFADNGDIAHLQELLSRGLGMPVKIEDDNGTGKVVIHFYNLEQLDKLLDKLNN
jgi:ParB family chromosome partitioning protein